MIAGTEGTNCSEQKKKQLYKAYLNAVNSNTLIHTIKLPDTVDSSSSSRTVPRTPTITLNDIPAEYQTFLRRMKEMPKVGDRGPGMWVFRRMGYTEADNPDHQISVMTGTGGSLLVRHPLAALKPTVMELLTIMKILIVDGLDQHTQMMAMMMGLQVSPWQIDVCPCNR